MAKNKTKKDDKKNEFPYAKEIEGIILILFGVLGFGKFGPVGRVIRNFAVFLFGNWYILVLVISILLGAVVIIKRDKPNYFNARLVGIYMILISILLLAHLEYVKNNEVTGVEILKQTMNNITATFSSPSLIKHTGGGIIGGLLATAFVSLFDIPGTLIVCAVIAVFGAIMLFNITLLDIINFVIKPFKKKQKSIEEMSEEGERDLDERIRIEDEKNDGKVVITNISEITRPTPLEQYREDYKKPKEVIETTEDLITNLDASNTQHEPKVKGDYVLPPIDLLQGSKNKGKVNSTEFITSNNKILERVLMDFAIQGRVREVHVGPTVTQYEVEVKAGTKLSKITSINKEIALALAAKDVRIQAPIPGKSTVGIEIPNPVTSEVKMKDILMGIPKKLDNAKLVAPLGLDIMGNIQYFDISKAPHMLVAGATGSGKSVCINNIITSILMRAKPDEVRMILVDPKKVELNCYEGVPHLMRPVVCDPKKASVALQKVCMIMDERYDMFAASGTRNIASYNEYVEKNQKSRPGLEKIPYILVIIDELADLMMVAGKEVEASIMRITQLARAAGIHLIVATQRPSTDVITGIIKSNIPTRVSFMVSTNVDSRTILDMSGAEKLLGKGDMLFLPSGEPVPIRIQGSYVSDDEINRVVDFVKAQGYQVSVDEKMQDLDNGPKEEMMRQESAVNGGNGEQTSEDALYNDVVEFAIRAGKISASLIQRKYRVGYNKAARMIDMLEENGVIGPQNGSKPREVLMTLGSEQNNGGEE